MSGLPWRLNRSRLRVTRNCCAALSRISCATRFATRHPERTSRCVCRRREGRVVIEVRDYGPGVPPESLHRIFDAFYRVEPDRDRASGGVGFGLAISRRAIELHHGNVTARNAQPGLIVEIELPVSS